MQKYIVSNAFILYVKNKRREQRANSNKPAEEMSLSD